MNVAERIASIIDGILAIEGGYVNDPIDRGGETKYGITVAVARTNGYDGPMRELPLDLARQIYRNRYIHVPRFDAVLAIDEAIGAELIDTGVNMGPAVAAQFLQRWLNGFNVGGHYQDLFVDGRVGPLTLAALRAFLARRGGEGRAMLLRGLNGAQAARYLDITERDSGQRRFLYGWVRNRVHA